MSATSVALLLVCLAAGSWQLSIKEFEVPKAIEVGNDAELQCQYELDANDTEAALFVKWWWIPESTTNDNRKLIYQRIAGQPPRPIHYTNLSKIDIKDSDTIILRNVTPIDSGTYECEVSDVNEIRQRGQLAVFSRGDGPILTFTEIEETTDDQTKKTLLVITCQAEDVAPKPTLSVTIQGHEVNMSSVIEDEDNNGFFTVFANTTLNAEDISESEVRCEIFYSNTNIAHPAYVDVKTFVPTGCDTQSTTVTPEDTTELETPPESLQNPRDSGLRLHSTWILLTFAVIFQYFQHYFKFS